MRDSFGAVCPEPWNGGIPYLAKRGLKRLRDWQFRRKWGSPPPEDFRTHTIGPMWFDELRPQHPSINVYDLEGKEFCIRMKSERTAVFRLVNVDRATGVDWHWLDLKFVRYT